MSELRSRRPTAAVIGVGFVGVQHVEALRRIGVEVAVVAASGESRARDAAQALDVPRWTGDWKAAASDGSVDVVHVCVPNDLHRVAALTALGAGKHVICEKPLGLDLAEGREMAAAAARSDRVAVLCHNYRFFPMVAELQQRVSDGALGRLSAIRGAYLQDWLLAADATNWRIDAGRGGRSRAIADIGSHWIDLAEMVTQTRLEAVMADTGTLHERRPGYQHVGTFATGGDGAEWMTVTTEDQAGLLLRFHGGISGTLTLSQVAAGHSNDLTISIDGTGGSATWRQERPDELWIGGAGASQTIARSPAHLSPAARHLAHLPAGHNEGWADALRNLLAAAYAAIDRRRHRDEEAAAALPTFEDGVRHLAFVEAALSSASQGRWIAIDDVLESTPSVQEVS
jgi:predicted dehydrogenase